MLIKPITREEVIIRVDAEPDDCPVEGSVSASGDDAFDREVEREILQRLDRGDVWAWATVTVAVSWQSFEVKTYLGGCSYKDEEDFRQPNGCFDDIVEEALEELNKNLSQAYQQLKERATLSAIEGE